MNKKNFIITMLALAFSSFSFAEETTLEKVNTSKNKAVDSVKEGYRNIEDKVCETVNGKSKCIGKKIKHKAETLKDKTETKVQEIKDKID